MLLRRTKLYTCSVYHAFICEWKSHLFNLEFDIDAGHLAAVSELDLSLGVVGPGSDELGQDVGDVGDLDLNGGLSPVHAGVQGRGTGLALRHVGGAQEVRELVQEVVSVILAVQIK